MIIVIFCDFAIHFCSVLTRFLVVSHPLAVAKFYDLSKPNIDGYGGATGEVHHTMLRLFSHTTSTLDVSIHENKVIGTDFSSTDTYLHVFTHILVNSSLFAVN